MAADVTLEASRSRRLSSDRDILDANHQKSAKWRNRLFGWTVITGLQDQLFTPFLAHVKSLGAKGRGFVSYLGMRG